MSAIDILGNGGVLKTILKEGYDDKTPKDGDHVNVLYSGRLVDETEPFDSSLDPHSPFTFELGQGRVIKGWDEVVKTMRVGEKIEVTLKPEYAYGDSGSPPKIPGNSTLVFEIELLGWKPGNALTEDGKVLLEITGKSEGEWKTAKDHWEVELALGLVGHEKNTVMVTIGEKKDKMNDILQLVAQKLKRKEKGLLKIESGYIDNMEDIEYEVELVNFYEVEDVLKYSDANKIWKKVLKEGEGYEKPKLGREVTVTVSGQTEDGSVVVSAEAPTQFVLGRGDLPDGIEIAIENMKKGEEATFDIAAEYVWSAKKAEALNVPVASYSAKIHLIDYDKGKDRWEMTGQEKLDYAKQLKEFGNSYFSQNKIKSAIRFYDKSIEYFEYDAEKMPELSDEIEAIKLSCYLNLAACYLKVSDWAKTIVNADKALKIKSSNTKALYRRAQAKLNLQELEAAKRDCTRILEIDPQSQETRVLLHTVQQKIKEIAQKERKIFSGMFSKLKFVNDDEGSKPSEPVQDVDIEEERVEPSPEQDKMEVEAGK